MIQKEMGQNIQRIRKSKGYTQLVFAGLLQISPNHLSKIERGKKNPSLRVFLEIAYLLQTAPSELLKDHAD